MDETDRLRELVAINRMITSTLDYDEVLRLVMEKTATLTQADAALLLLADDDKQTRVAASVNVDPEKARHFAARLDERIDAAFGELLGLRGEDSYLAAPVMDHGAIAGILVVYWRGQQPPTEAMVYLVSALADQAASALGHAVRYQKVRHDLQIGDAIARAIGEATPFGAWISDAAGVPVYLSDSFLQRIGMTLEECAGPAFKRVFDPEDTERMYAEWQRCVQRGDPVWEREFKIRGTDGCYYTVLGRGAPVRDPQGQITHWAGINLDITEQKRAEASRTELMRRLALAQEEERRRIARELHDEMGQHLAALILGLKSLSHILPKETAIHERLQELQCLTGQIGHQVHRIALELRPTALDDLGLHSVLQTYLEEWSERTGIEAHFHSSGLDTRRLPSPLETTLYRIVQEALTNVLKHAHAKRVSLILERHDDHVRAIIEDNGQGFDVEAVMPGAGEESRLGLLGMKERLALVEGTLEIESSPGTGTTLFVRIPLSSKEEGGSDG